MTDQEYVEFLDKKYPNINPVEGENLNLAQNTKRLISVVWMDRNTYPNGLIMQDVLGLSERSIYRLVRYFGLPRRTTLKPSDSYEGIKLSKTAIHKIPRKKHGLS